MLDAADVFGLEGSVAPLAGAVYRDTAVFEPLWQLRQQLRTSKVLRCYMSRQILRLG